MNSQQRKKLTSKFLLMFLIFTGILPNLFIIHFEPNCSLKNPEVEDINDLIDITVQSEKLGQIYGTGLPRSSLIQTNISDFQTDRTESMGISVQTNNWNITYTNFTFFDINAMDTWKSLELNIDLLDWVWMNGTWAVPLTIPFDLYLDTIEIRDFALRTGGLSLADTINVTISIWNSTLGGALDEVISQISWTNRPYTFSPFFSAQIDAFNLTAMGSSVLLDDGITNNNKFFVAINCTKKILAVNDILTLIWYYDDTPGFKESYNWTTAWNQDNSKNLTMSVYLKPFNTLRAPSAVNLKVNSIAVVDSGLNSGNWINTSYIIAQGSNTNFQVSSNWSISYDIIINCVIQNLTQFPSSFFGKDINNLINWNVTIGLQTIPLRSANFTINVTAPFNWNQTTPLTFRPNNPVLTAPVLYLPGGSYSYFIINVNGGTWVLYCHSINYMDTIAIEKQIAGQFNVPLTLNTTMNITDTIRINATMKNNPTGNVNLSIFSSQNMLNYTDTKTINNAMASFTPFAFDSFTNTSGVYFIQVSWENGEQAGIKNLTFEVVYPTTLKVYSPTTQEFILNTPINLTVQYTNEFQFNTFNETGIENAKVTCIFGNSTINNILPLNPLGNGNYYTIIDTNSFEIGDYTCNVTAGLPARNNLSISFNIALLYNTSIISNLLYAELYYEFNVSVLVNYSTINPAFGIIGAEVKCFIDGYFYSNLNEIAGGNYSIQVNTSQAPYKIYPGFHEIKINATSPNFIVSQIFIILLINAAPTELRLHNNITQQGGQRFNLTVTYNTTSLLGGKYLVNSTIRCLLDGTELNEVGSPVQLNNGRFFVNNFNNGSYNIEFLIDIGANRTQNEGNPFVILVIAAQDGYAEINTTGIINIWVWNTTLLITSWDASVIYGQNVTINLLYYNKTSNLIDGIVNCDYPGNIVIKNNQGNYTITFNTTGHHAGDWLIAVNVTLTGHEWNLTYLFIHVYGTPNLISPYPDIAYSIKVNQTLQNLIVTYNQINGLPIPYANVEIIFYNATHTFSNNTNALRIYYSYVNGICTIELVPQGIHQGAYNLTVRIENHTDTYAFEQNSTTFLISINPLESYLIPIKEGNWWSGNSLVWYENETVILKLNFIATQYDLGPIYNTSVHWGALSFNLYPKGDPTPYSSGLCMNLNNGSYVLNLILDMLITPLSSNYHENYVLELIGNAFDCITFQFNISLQYYAKNIVSISLILPIDVIEGETVKFSAKLTDSFGTGVPNEQITFIFTITYKSGLQEILVFYISTDSNGIASVILQLPYNVDSFEISIQSALSVSSVASDTEKETLKIHTAWYLPFRFLKRTWYIFVLVTAVTLTSYYYFKKYKPKIVKIEEKRDTLNYKYVSAVNLMHLLVYERQSRELLYAYSSPGLKLTSYLMNSILQSMSMYVDMDVEYQEVYLQDDICLTLTDGTIIRIAVLSKNLPSIEMQKQIAEFIDLFETEFQDKIPEAIENIVNVSRVINLDFANNIIEKCFEKSLTFPHIVQRPADNQSLTEEENKIHKLAYNLIEKSGPFLLGRLLAKAQVETGITELPRLIEIVFKLREKEAIKPIQPKEADRLKDEMMREKVNKEDSKNNL